MTRFLREYKLVTFRELKSLLSLPLFYILSGVFFMLTSLIYLQFLIEFAQGAKGVTVNVTDSVIRPAFHSVHFFLMIQIPLLTMRVFSEDRATGMLDLLQTTPARDWSLVLGKFKGTCIGLSFYIACTALFPIVTSFMGTVEWPVIVGSLIALALSSAAYVAIGIFFSSLTESQVVAAVLSYVTIFLLFIAQYFADSFQILPLQQAMRHFSIMEHMGAILAGNIAVMNVVYFLALMAIFLFMTTRVLESRRWSA